MLRLSRSLRDSATQDTDKPKIQPVSESLRVCIVVSFPAIELGKLEVDYSGATS